MSDNHDELDEDVDVFDLSKDTTPSAEQKLRLVVLPSSSTLSISEADQFLCWRDASIVAIVGESNGGKTTLITELYGSFMRGPFADLIFCHSLSLQGFEKKSFQSRAESGRLTPDTPRTSVQDGLSFFHLAVSNESDLKRHDLLISERAGEDYRHIRDNPALISEVIELRKASSVALIIDGEKVASSRKRAEAYASVRHIIQALVSIENTTSLTRIQLVTTKFDLLEGDDLSHARASLSQFEESISSIIAGRFEVSTFRTAARDPRPGSKPAIGLDQLLKKWIQPPLQLPSKDIPMPELTDEFDRLMLKRGSV